MPNVMGSHNATVPTEDGLSSPEIVHCIKRYLASGLFPILIADLANLT